MDIPLPSSGFGAFQHLHGFESAPALISELARRTEQTHGVAGRRFLRALNARLDRNAEEVVASLEGLRDSYLTVARKEVVAEWSAINRVHDNFATIYAAARQAQRFGLLPGKRDDCIKAILACEKAHVRHVALHLAASANVRSAQAASDPLTALKIYVQDNFKNMPDLSRGLLKASQRRDHDNFDGYVNVGPGGERELLFSDAAFTRACGGPAPAKRLKASLSKLNLLVRDSHRPSTRRQIFKTGDRSHVIAVRARAFVVLEI